MLDPSVSRHAPATEKEAEEALGCSRAEVMRDHPGDDAAVGELMQAGEREAAWRIIQTIVGDLKRMYGGGKVLRDAHPKSHGCVAMELRVEQDLPENLAKGIFQPGAVYAGRARFSNTAKNAGTADTEGDGRGMAIKLFDVDIAPEIDGRKDMDLLLVTHPQFMLRRMDAYVRVIELLHGKGANAKETDLGKVARLINLTMQTGISGLLNLLKFKSGHVSNPLAARYWSMVPYRLGGKDDPDRAPVMYSALPPLECADVPPHAGPDYLREALRVSLASGEVRFDFCVQALPAGIDRSAWVERPRRHWPEAKFPFVKVATIVFPQQNLDFAAPDAFGEDWSFNPWRCPEEHRPIGAVNRVRKTVYKTISRFRRTANGVSLEEPKG